MHLFFGLELDDLSLPRPTLEGGVHYCGKKGLLQLLEAYLGLDGHPEDIEYLRVEQYRQAVIRLLSDLAAAPDVVRQPAPFFQKSFEADQFATAAELLVRRDELRLAGWNFEANDATPTRLATLADIEVIFNKEKKAEESQVEDDPQPLILSPGYADRFAAVLKTLDAREHPFTEILLNEPLELLPFHFQRLFKKMGETATRPVIRQSAGAEHGPEHVGSDLQKFQQRLVRQGLESQTVQGRQSPASEKINLTNDGSLLLIRAKRASEAAAWLAQLIRLNRLAGDAGKEKSDSSGISLLIPEKNRMLEMALIGEGLPSLGIQSASLARPTLQILKLVPAFLWEPVDPFKILEFVSLSVKPLPDELATLIANQVAIKPGLQGEGWNTMITRYFEELAENQPDAEVKEQRRQYNIWFDRPRYDMNRTAPKNDVIRMFDYLREWAYDTFEDGNGKNHSLLVLSSQSRRIVELLQALPETELTHLELERIVRTIYEPSPIVFREREAGHIPYVMHPGAFTGAVDEIWWWNFIQNEPPHFFSRWYQNERDYLLKQSIRLGTPEQENTRQCWQQTRPVLMAQKRLVLVLPETVDGTEALPHPLFGDLQAAFSNLETITHDLERTPAKTDESPLAKHFILPKYEKMPVKLLGKPKPFLHVRNLEKLQREKETLTSLEALFYYPYQWFFRHKIRLSKSSILSVVKDETLMGNLAHRVFEKILQQDIYHLEKSALERLVEQETRPLLIREGAVLLMYGREPERVHFVNKLKYAVWSLVCHIRDNGWRVKDTEMSLEGSFPVSSDSRKQVPRVPVKGIADLVLERGDEIAIVDLKWRGSSRREQMLRNEEDLQLVLYARLLSPENQWAHTSYFIIENGRMLARNNQAFSGINPITPTEDHRDVNERILQRMEATWHWRMQQLSNGLIEIRCRQTLQEIEEAYSGEEQGEWMLQILEMKNDEARYDDYRTLINLIE